METGFNRLLFVNSNKYIMYRLCRNYSRFNKGVKRTGKNKFPQRVIKIKINRFLKIHKFVKSKFKQNKK